MNNTLCFEGTWNNISGGCFNYPTWRENTQYLLNIFSSHAQQPNEVATKPKPPVEVAELVVTIEADMPPASNASPIGAYIIKGSEQQERPWACLSKVVTEKAILKLKFVKRPLIKDIFNLKCGTYVIIPCAFFPNSLSSFRMTLSSPTHSLSARAIEPWGHLDLYHGEWPCNVETSAVHYDIVSPVEQQMNLSVVSTSKDEVPRPSVNLPRRLIFHVSYSRGQTDYLINMPAAVSIKVMIQANRALTSPASFCLAVSADEAVSVHILTTGFPLQEVLRGVLVPDAPHPDHVSWVANSQWMIRSAVTMQAIIQLALLDETRTPISDGSVGSGDDDDDDDSCLVPPPHVARERLYLSSANGREKLYFPASLPREDVKPQPSLLFLLIPRDDEPTRPIRHLTEDAFAKHAYGRASQVTLMANTNYVLIPVAKSLPHKAQIKVSIASPNKLLAELLEDTWTLTTVQGRWLGNSCGGCLLFMSCLDNPQFMIRFITDGVAYISLAIKSGNPDAIGMYLVRNRDPSLSRVFDITKDLVAAATFRSNTTITALAEGRAGEAINVIPCTYYPKREEMFALQVAHDPNQKLEIISLHTLYHELVICGKWKAAPHMVADLSRHPIKCSFIDFPQYKIVVYEDNFHDDACLKIPVTVVLSQVAASESLARAAIDWSLISIYACLTDDERYRRSTIVPSNILAMSQPDRAPQVVMNLELGLRTRRITIIPCILEPKATDSLFFLRVFLKYQNGKRLNYDICALNPRRQAEWKTPVDAGRPTTATFSFSTGAEERDFLAMLVLERVTPIRAQVPTAPQMTLSLHAKNDSKAIKRITYVEGELNQLQASISPGTYHLMIQAQRGNDAGAYSSAAADLPPLQCMAWIRAFTDIPLQCDGTLAPQDVDPDPSSIQTDYTTLNLRQGQGHHLSRWVGDADVTRDSRATAKEARLVKAAPPRSCREKHSLQDDERMVTDDKGRPRTWSTVPERAGDAAVAVMPAVARSRSPREATSQDVMVLRISHDEYPGEEVQESEEGEGLQLHLPPRPFSPKLTPSIGHSTEDDPTTTSEGPAASKRHALVLKEILATERTYINALTLLMNHFMSWMMIAASGSCYAETIRKIFANVPVILNYSKAFYKELKEAMDHDQRVGKVFQRFASFFLVYAEYINNYTENCREIERIRLAKPYGQHLQRLELDPKTNRLSLNDYYMMPVQRVPRYVLLLEHALSAGPAHPQDAAEIKASLEKIRSVANDINEKKLRSESMALVLNLQRSLTPKGSIQDGLAVPWRYVVLEGVMRIKQLGLHEVKQGLTLPGQIAATTSLARPRSCYLFNDLFLVTKNRGRKSEFIAALVIDSRTRIQGLDQSMFILSADEPKPINILFIDKTPQAAAQWVEKIQHFIKHPQSRPHHRYETWGSLDLSD